MLDEPIPVDVWIDGDGQTRKISMEIDTRRVVVSTTIEYYDFGADVDVEHAAARTTSSTSPSSTGGLAHAEPAAAPRRSDRRDPPGR